jgi:hypothetical protein
MAGCVEVLTAFLVQWSVRCMVRCTHSLNTPNFSNGEQRSIIVRSPPCGHANATEHGRTVTVGITSYVDPPHHTTTHTK